VNRPSALFSLTTAQSLETVAKHFANCTVQVRRRDGIAQLERNTIVAGEKNVAYRWRQYNACLVVNLAPRPRRSRGSNDVGNSLKNSTSMATSAQRPGISGMEYKYGLTAVLHVDAVILFGHVVCY
jgi:hypothetical protein